VGALVKWHPELVEGAAGRAHRSFLWSPKPLAKVTAKEGTSLTSPPAPMSHRGPAAPVLQTVTAIETYSTIYHGPPQLQIAFVVGRKLIGSLLFSVFLCIWRCLSSPNPFCKR